MTSLVALLRERAQRTPDRLAYRYHSDGLEASLSYADLDRRARQIASRLQSLQSPGAVEGARAILLYPPGLEFVAGFFGCLYAGMIAVPVNAPSRRGVARLRAVIEDSEPRVVLTVRSFTDRLELCQAGSFEVLTDDAFAHNPEDWRDPDVAGEDVAVLQYTSGSLGSPKGVILTHGNIMENEAQIQASFNHDETSTVIHWLPHFHDMGLIGNLLQPMYVGAQCVVMSPMEVLLRPVRWLQAITEYRGRTSGGPTFAYDLCVRKISAEQEEMLDLSSWECAYVGAEPVRADVLETFANRFGSRGFRRRAFHPCYGLAEATLLVSGAEPFSGFRVAHARRDALAENRVVQATVGNDDVTRLVSCGRPWGTGKILIVDAESRRARSANEIGEIWVAGPNVAKGYWNRPDLTRETFEARVPGDEHRYLRTGDLGVLLDDELYVTGRRKELLIIRGHNFYPYDIEHSVERAHSMILPHSCVAFSIGPDGSDEDLIVVCEVGRQTLTREQSDEVTMAVRRAVYEDHSLSASAVELLPPFTVPKTLNGKLRREQCRRAYCGGELARVRIADQSQEAGAGPKSEVT